MSKRKRGAGEGSIYLRADGRWAGAVSLGNIEGTPKRKTVYGRTRREVQERLSRLLVDQQHGLPAVGEKLTLAEFLKDWLINWVKPSVKPRTFGSYADTVRLHLVPTLGRTAITKLSPQNVQAMLNERLAANLSPRSVAYMRSVLRIALHRALKLGLVHRNVVDLVDPPRVARHEITPLSVEEAKKLVAKAQEHRFGAVVTVALALGLRKGEALGLRWQDVDLEAGSLAVTGTLQRLPKGGLVRDETKNSTSRRVIILPTIAIKTLREHRVRQMQERLAAGERWVDTGYVFTTTLGGPVCPRNLLRYFAKILGAAQLSPTRFHDLRHSCASLLFAQGVPAKVVQDILGHSALRVTMDLYTHLTGSMRGQAAAEIDAVFGT